MASLLILKFNNEFSIADILSLLALLAMFITILQVKNQDKRNIKPTIVFKENTNYYEYNTCEEDSGVKVQLELSNIGLGVAKTVKVYTSLDLSKFKGLTQNIEITTNTLEINDDKRKALYMIGDKEENFLYMEPDRKICFSSIVSHYINVLGLLYTNIMKNKENRDAMNILLGQSNQGDIYCVIAYTDIYGKIYNSYFQLKIVPVMIAEDSMSFNINVKEITSKEYRLYFKEKQKINGSI